MANISTVFLEQNEKIHVTALHISQASTAVAMVAFAVFAVLGFYTGHTIMAAGATLCSVFAIYSFSQGIGRQQESAANMARLSGEFLSCQKQLRVALLVISVLLAINCGFSMANLLNTASSLTPIPLAFHSTRVGLFGFFSLSLLLSASLHLYALNQTQEVK